MIFFKKKREEESLAHKEHFLTDSPSLKKTLQSSVRPRILTAEGWRRKMQQDPSLKKTK